MFPYDLDANLVVNHETTKTPVRLYQGLAMKNPDIKDLKARLEGSNVSATTFLATDYLNHYNEVFMLLEMVPDMPDMLEELEEWQPKSYVQHFRDSSLGEAELAIEAYENCPLQYRLPFDQLTERLDQIIQDTILEAQKLFTADDIQGLNGLVERGLYAMKKLWEALNAIIHANQDTLNQGAVDDLLNEDFALSQAV